MTVFVRSVSISRSFDHLLSSREIRTGKGEAYSKHHLCAQDSWGNPPSVFVSGKCGILGNLWIMRHQRYAGWLPGSETARREQGRCRAGQCGGHLLCRVLCHTVDIRCADSDMDMDLGRGNRSHQDCQSSFGTVRLQTVLLSSHQDQQTNGISTFPGRADAVLVYHSHSNCGRGRDIRRCSGRSFDQDTEGLRN